MSEHRPASGGSVEPLRRFEGRRAVVTGASRGIGVGIARRLAAEGAAVALVARTAEPGHALGGSLSEVGHQIRADGGVAVEIDADLADPEGRSSIVAHAIEALGGPIDVLVNNAAAAIYAPPTELATRHARLMFEINVLAPLELTRDVVSTLGDAPEAWVVNVSSRTSQPWAGPPFEVGVMGTTTTAYGASKAALERATNGLAAELHPRDIRVNALAPRAAVMTEGAQALVGDRLGAHQVESLEHMVEAVVALCCCGSDVTGRSTTSPEVLEELGLPVRDLAGAAVLPPNGGSQ